MAAGTTNLETARPRLRGWRRAAALCPVVIGCVFGAGALVSAAGAAAWIVAAIGLEATVGTALTVLLLTRSPAVVAWWAAAAACASGWVAYAAAAGPWTWPGELSLVLLAAILAALWPVSRGLKPG